MLSAETKRKIDSLRDTLVGKIPVPHQQVEQITLALIYKFMSDIDEDNRELGGQSFFNDHYKKYRWENVMDRSKQGHERVLLYSEGLEQMALNEHLPQLFRDIFKGAYLPFKDPVVFDHFLKGVNEFAYGHSEELGNAFEYLLSIMGSQGDAGQFRTPRHIIDFIVEAVDPAKDDTILDPACGTAGFLISAYKHILKSNVDPKSGQPGSALSSTERQKLGRQFTGYDISHEMVRLSLANLYLHGFPEPRVYEYDTLSSEERWYDDFSCVLANPPFMTPRGGIQPHRRFSVQSRRAEVLFVDYIMEHLTSQGKAGIIVPEGIIFQSGTPYKQLRKMLVDDGYLYAVVSLPSGVFQPYAGVKTCILLIDKPIAQKARDILFVKVENDGFSLSTQRRPVDQNDLPAALDVIGKYKEAVREGRSFSNEAADESDAILQEKEKRVSAKLVSKSDIAESGDYNLSGDRYAKHFVAHVDPVKLTLRVNPVVVRTTHSKWPIASLEEVSTLIQRGKTPKYGKSENQVIKSGQARGYIEFDFTERYFVSKDFDIDHRKLQKGDILINSTGVGTAGRVTLFNLDGNYLVDGHITIVRLDQEKILPTFLLYSLIARYGFSGIEKMAVGNGGQVELSLKTIKALTISLPPLSLQEEIVAEIDRYQKIIDGAQQVIDNWEPKIEVDPEWPKVKLGEVCGFVRGPFGGSLKKEIFVKNGYAVYEQSHAISGSLDSVRYFIAPEKYEEMKRFRVMPGDLVMSCSGTMGKTAIVPKDVREGVINQALLKLTPNKNLDVEFLKLWMDSSYFQGQLASNVSGVAIKNVASVKVLRELLIPLPSREVQEELINELQKEKKLITTNRELMKIMRDKIDLILSKI